MKKYIILSIGITLILFNRQSLGEPEAWTLVQTHHFGAIRSALRSQGMATDDEGHFWYSSAQSLLRAPSRLGLAKSLHFFPIPKELRKLKDNHIGDIDYADRKIFAPIEDGSTYNNPFVGVFDSKTLKLLTYFSLPQPWQRDGVPWIAVDHKNKKIFSSEYSNVTKINVYDMDTLKPCAQFPLLEKMESIQGAKVLDDTMYLTANDNDGSGFAIYKVEIKSGKVEKIIALPRNLVEVEGLAITRSPLGLVIDALGVVPIVKKVHLSRRMILFTFKKNET